MQDIWSEIENWRESKKPTALATIIKVEGSSLRPVSSKLAVTNDNQFAGSITGGCVEGAVYEEAQQVIQSGAPRRLSYGVTDSTAWSVGLACGGSIEVFLESLASAPWQSLEGEIRHCIEQKQLSALVTVVSGPAFGNKLLIWPDGRQSGDLGSLDLNAQAAAACIACWRTHSPVLASLSGEAEGSEIFIDVFTPPLRLVIVGAVHIAIPLVTIAKTMGFHTTVIDARSAFATRERFPHVDQLIKGWPADALRNLHPDEATYVVCLSHDDKLDNPALQVALASKARYVGALGSRKTHAGRLLALREMGVAEESLARIHAPVGLHLGARYPEEIALAVMAEIIAVRHGVLPG